MLWGLLAGEEQKVNSSQALLNTVTHTHTKHTYAHIHMCMHTHIHAYTCVYMYIVAYICMYACIVSHTYTHNHTLK